MKIRTCQELFLFASLLFLLGNGSLAWADQPTAIDTSLAQLENRYFEHPYNQDTETDRLSRLEGFIFGSAQDGTVEDRLKHILTSIPPVIDQSQLPNSNNTKSTAPKAISQNTGDSNSGHLPDGSTYPRVTNLEQELLGRTFVDDALTKRLARLETKAFGIPSTNNDLSQRVDQLDQYADRHDLYGERKSASLPYSEQPNTIRPYAPSTSGRQTGFSGSISERLAMMEAQEFGRTYPERSLEKRLKKLEDKIFPDDKKRFANKPLPDQVNALWLTMHPNGSNAATPLLGSSPANAQAVDAYANNSPQGQSSNTDSNDRSSADINNNSPHHGWLHTLAKTAGTVGKVAVGSMSGFGGYPGYGGYSSFARYGGYGGYGGGGYGGYGNGSYFGTPSYYGNTLPYSY